MADEPQLILLPGVVLPAALSYGPLRPLLAATGRAATGSSTRRPAPVDVAAAGGNPRHHGRLRSGGDRAGRSCALRPPVYIAIGELSNPALYAAPAVRLCRTLPDCELEVYADRHHFDPPHRIEPQRFTAALRRLCARAGRA